MKFTIQSYQKSPPKRNSSTGYRIVVISRSSAGSFCYYVSLEWIPTGAFKIPEILPYMNCIDLFFVNSYFRETSLNRPLAFVNYMLCDRNCALRDALTLLCYWPALMSVRSRI